MRIIQQLVRFLSLAVVASAVVACVPPNTQVSGSTWFHPGARPAPAQTEASAPPSEPDASASEASQGDETSSGLTPSTAPNQEQDTPSTAPNQEEDEEEQLPETGRHIGQACQNDDQCVSQWCTGGSCSHKTWSRLPKGEYCDGDNQCVSNHCYSSECQ